MGGLEPVSSKAGVHGVVGIAAAFVATVAMTTLLLACGHGVFVVQRSVVALVGVGMFAVAGAATAWTGRGALAPWPARVAVVTVALLAATIVGAGLLWNDARPRAGEDAATLAVLHPLPIDGVAGWLAGGGSAVVLLLAASRRWRSVGTPTWLRVGLVASASFAVALGAWLAIYAQVGHYPTHPELVMMGPDSAAMGGVIAWLVGPPLLVAAVAGALAARRRRLSSRAVRVVVGLVALALVVALGSALGPHSRDADIHEEHVIRDAAPLLMAAICLVVAHALAIGVAHLRSLGREPGRAAPWQQVGTIEAVDGAPAVAHLHDRGWLAGVDVSARGFALHTASGVLPVPAGAAVIAPLPVAAMAIAPGTSLPVLASGARVEVTGFVAGDAANGYRATARPIAGTGGIVVRAPRGLDDSPVTEFLARVWRPCLAALVATMLAAAPALASLIATDGDDDTVGEGPPAEPDWCQARDVD
ncbi:MAG: hypothetical protein IPH44_25110 [Myxococcales bacterium]|nr:hypothetical protein [Myxococcales bacterium]